MFTSPVGRARLSLVAVLVVTGACGPSHRLAEYDFRDHTLAVVAELPNSPDILTGPLFVGTPSNPLEAIALYDGSASGQRALDIALQLSQGGALRD